MPDIDELFIDVDFTQDPRYVYGDLGGQLCTGGFGVYEETFGVLSDAEIDAEIERIDAAGGGAERLVTRIYNQKQEGSCVANATCQAHEVVQAVQFGKDRVIHLSAMSVYRRIGSGPNSGAMVSDGLEELTKRGALPLDSDENKARFAHTMPNTGWSNKLPSGWEETAKQFAGVESYVLRSVGGLLTALCNQHPVVVGREGHSICYVRPMRKDGRRIVAYANSWGGGENGWGSPLGDHQTGFGFDSENQIKKSASWAFALRSVTIPGNA